MRVPISRFTEPEDEEGSSSPEPTEEFEFELTDTAATHADADAELRAQLEDPPSPPDAADDGHVPTSSDEVPSPSPTVLPVQHGAGPKALPRLKPCPYCGEKLVEKGETDSKWYGHKDEAGECWASAARIRDEVDANRWNTRAVQARTGTVSRSLTAPNGLEPKQIAFIDEYMRDRNATQAAIRAGYSRKTARQMGAENLAKPAICTEINRRIAEYSRTAGIDRMELLRQLDAMSRVDIRKLFAPEGGILPPSQWPDECHQVVAAYNPATARGGAKIRFVSRFDILLNILYEISPLEEKLARLSGQFHKYEHV